MQSVDKKYFLFNKGINTEAPLVAWPEGFTVDEQNFDLLPDGSRRRRLGISYEAGVSNNFMSFSNSKNDLSSGTKFYRWKNVANTDEFNLIVAQVGASLYFWDDPLAGPLGLFKYVFPLEDYKVVTDTYTASDDDLMAMTCSFAEIDGKLIVSGEHIETLSISYEDNMLLGKTITIIERDLFGLDDGLDVAFKPTTLTPEHRYNLYCRGWSNSNIMAFYNDEDVFPSKNMIQFMGLRKQSEATYADESGIKVFSPDKLMKELFQNMSAPVGHLTRNVFNRQIAFGNQGESAGYRTIAEVSLVRGSLPLVRYVQLKVSEATHGTNVGETITISGLVVRLRTLGEDRAVEVDLSGLCVVREIVDDNTINVSIPKAALFLGVLEDVVSLGQYMIGELVETTFEEFAPSVTRFSTVATFAGRIFYGGCPDTRLTDRIYYSKVIETDRDFGKCYQEADPTSEFISDLLPSDGGYITIANLGMLRGMLPYGRALLLFSSEGVWAIGPGESGIFSATGYSVNKISDAGCIARQSIVLADNVPMYWSNSGIYAIMQDSNSGFLTSTNVTQDVINGLYHSIRYTEKTRCKAEYDSIRKRVFFLYNSRLKNPPTGDAPMSGESEEYSTSITPLGKLDDTDEAAVSYDSALIFDLRLGAWVKWRFGHGDIKVRDILCLPTNYSTDSLNGGIRFLCQEEETTKYYLGELTSTVYEDWGTEASAFLYTGPDSLGEPERFRYAPYVHVFMRKEVAEPLVVSQSPAPGTLAAPGSTVMVTLSGRATSLLMQPRWDWARGSDSGKITNYVQVYRETKPNPDAFGLVVTKNKVRGRGRNLFLSFKAGPKAPAWLDGWTVKYDAQIRI